MSEDEDIDDRFETAEEFFEGEDQWYDIDDYVEGEEKGEEENGEEESENE